MAEGAASNSFLEYHEPSTASLLTLVSFFFVLSTVEWALNKLCGAGLVGQIVVGALYGVPVGDILLRGWQEAFVALGYLGLVLILFEGGLTIRLDLLRQNLVLSLGAAAVGILVPIGLSYLLLYLAFGHGALETFIVGAALSTTSVGTTFTVLKGAASETDFSFTRVGTVLISAALFDDISGLVMISVIQKLAGTSGDLGWVVGRPIVASLGIGLVPALLAVLVCTRLYRRHVHAWLCRYGCGAFITVEAVVLCAFLAVAGYAGASLLFGAFMAGAFLGAMSASVPAAEHGELTADGVPPLSFPAAFEMYVSGTLKYILQPLFFSSIGFAIPFRSLWTGEVIWKGVVFSVLMLIGKVVVGISVPVSDMASARTSSNKGGKRSMLKQSWAPSALLGCAMVARGEIGLLIIQTGLTKTPFLGTDAFIIAVWAIVLNTIVGPLFVGILVRTRGSSIADDATWGLQS